jgi:hypothetical protein
MSLKIEKTIKILNLDTLDYDVTEITRYSEKSVPSDNGTLIFELTEDEIRTQLWGLPNGLYRKDISILHTKPKDKTEIEYVKELIDEVFGDTTDDRIIQNIQEGIHDTIGYDRPEEDKINNSDYKEEMYNYATRDGGIS